jgi:hypothetical protein
MNVYRKRSHDPLKLLVNTITLFEDRSESLADSLQAFRSLDVHGGSLKILLY